MSHREITEGSKWTDCCCCLSHREITNGSKWKGCDRLSHREITNGSKWTDCCCCLSLDGGSLLFATDLESAHNHHFANAPLIILAVSGNHKVDPGGHPVTLEIAHIPLHTAAACIQPPDKPSIYGKNADDGLG